MRSPPIAFLTVLALASAASASVPPPAPLFDRIRYDRPGDYRAIQPSLGDAARINAVATDLTRDKPERSLAAIHAWIAANLTYDAREAYEYRDFGQACDRKVYGGCADYAVVFTALSRACGIPTVFVKTMDADWIREFRAAGTCTSWRGHVFLEVFIDGRWRLLDPEALRLYDDYDPANRRVLPGERWAYDKGDDPRQLVLSPDWERWKTQTAAHFKAFDLGQLPPGLGDRGRSLSPKVCVAADSPVWQMIGHRLQKSGRASISFNADWDVQLAKARGGDLVVTCVGTRLVLPPERHDLLPISYDQIQSRLKDNPTGIQRKTVADGTRVVLLFARDVAAMERLVAAFDLDDGR